MTGDGAPAFVAHLLGSPATPDDGGMGEAEVLTWSGSAGTLTDGRSVRAGFSCLIRPVPGDEVLVWSGVGGCCVLAILQRRDRTARAVLAMSGDTTLEAPRLAFAAQTVQIAAQDFLTSVRNRHIVEDTRTETSRLRVSQVETDVRRVTTSDDTVAGTLLQRAGTWISTTVHDARLTARSFLFS